MGNDELLASLSALISRARRVTADLLAHLAECDERRLHLDLGYSSLFAYCTESLGFCEATAWRRITAARVCRRFPWAFGLVASGTLHLSALCSLKPHLTAENASELFELCSNKSSRRIEQLLAGRFPNPDLADSIRRLPTRRAPASVAALEVETLTSGAGSTGAAIEPRTIPQGNAFAMVNELGSEGGRDGDPTPPAAETQRHSNVVFEATGSGAPTAMAEAARHALDVARTCGRASSARARLEPLSADRFGVRFTADAEFCALLERVRGLAAHRLPSGDLLTLLRRGLEAYEREITKERFGIGRKRSGNASAARLSPGSRHIPTAVANDVYLRDAGQCTFVSRDGRRCSARGRLELDHVEPWAVGGESTVQNLRLRCSAHNLWHAEKCFGSARTRAALVELPRAPEPSKRFTTRSDES